MNPRFSMRRIYLSILLLGLLVTSCGRRGTHLHNVTQRTASGAFTGAVWGGIIGGSRGARSGALVGGLLGAASTPSPQRSYHPYSVSSSQMSYVHY